MTLFKTPSRIALCAGLLALTTAAQAAPAGSEPAPATSPSPAAVVAEADAVAGPKARITAVYAAIAKAAVEAPDQQALTASLQTALADLVDYEAFAARTLKKTWPTLTAAQKSTFKTVFERLIVQVYAKRFKLKTEFEVTFRDAGVKLNKDGSKARVYTTVTGGKVSADVDYHFAKGERWNVYELVIDEVMMALNWRSKFEKIVAKSGFDALVAKITTQVDGDDDE